MCVLNLTNDQNREQLFESVHMSIFTYFACCEMVGRNDSTNKKCNQDQEIHRAHRFVKWSIETGKTASVVSWTTKPSSSDAGIEVLLRKAWVGSKLQKCLPEGLRNFNWCELFRGLQSLVMHYRNMVCNMWFLSCSEELLVKHTVRGYAVLHSLAVLLSCLCF